MADVAKLLWKNGGQEVVLPPGYQFEGEVVRIRREGRRVILEPAGNEVGDRVEPGREMLK